MLVILLPAVAKERAGAEFIFTHFNMDNGMGIQGKAYVLAVGMVVSQYSLLGYDTSAHMVRYILPPFQNVGRFRFSRCISFAMHLNIRI